MRQRSAEQALGVEKAHTVANHLPGRQSSCQRNSKRDPFLLHDRGAHDKKHGGDDDPGDILGGEESARFDEATVSASQSWE